MSSTVSSLKRLWGRKSDGSTLPRTVTLAEFHTSTPGNPAQNYCDNSIITSKYTLLNIVPKAIWEQFRRLSNFYFLIIAVVSFFPSISPVSPATTVMPLAVVVGFGLVRDVYEDFARKRQDRRANNKPVDVLVLDPASKSSNAHSWTNESTGAEWPSHTTVTLNSTPTRALRVGDIVCVRANQVFPADLVLLQSTGEGGVAYCSTANLDGESSLKRRLVPTPVFEVAPEEAADLLGPNMRKLELNASKPVTSLYDFPASLSIDADTRTVPLDEKNLLLRGSVLRNVDHVYGLVVYTGADTKVAINMRSPPSKLGQVERKMNEVVLGLFGALILITVIMAIIAGVRQAREGEDMWYMGDERLLSGSTVGIQSFGTFIILFHSFIPISLFVTLEFVRVIQGLFIYADLKMRSRGIPVIPKAGNLHEVLGNVEHILSDKTGTLTQNVMRFVACSVSEKLFDIREQPDALRSAVETNALNGAARELVRAMALTHTVVPEAAHSDGYDDEKEDEEREAKPVEYQGQSPDEVALVTAARENGVELLERGLESVTIQGTNSTMPQESYKVLAELEFSSERKRMSVVVRNNDTGRYFLYTKGADSVMLELVSTFPSATPDEFKRGVTDDIFKFAVGGLRTLVYARRELDEATLTEWHDKWSQASNLIENRSERLAELAAELEVGLHYLGATAVEDKLQDQVPETIQYLREAGVRIWVLTGDKLETAENIGYSANLLSRDMRVEIIRSEAEDEVHTRLVDIRDKIKSGEIRSSPISADATQATGEPGLSIIVDGKTLGLIESSDTLSEIFMEVSDYCKTVICARVTPSQKAKMVQLARRWRRATTLAIGDGGNDVSMIQEAHVGVGIVGSEGTQASLAADYSMAEFRHLLRLMTIHGRYSYIRSAGVINLSLYKNIVFTSTHIWYQFFAFATGPTIHNEWVVTMYNALITLAGPFLHGIFERDLEESTIEQSPSVYLSNRNNRLFSYRTVGEFTLAYSIWHGLVCFFGTYFFFGRSGEIPRPDGRDPGMVAAGFVLSILVVGTVQFKFFLSSHVQNWIIIAAFFVSYALLFAIVPIVIPVFKDYPLEGILSFVFSSSRFYTVWPVVFVTAFIPDFLVLLRRNGVFGEYLKGGEVSRLQNEEARAARHRNIRKLRLKKQ